MSAMQTATIRHLSPRTVRIASWIGFLGALFAWVLFWLYLTNAHHIVYTFCGELWSQRTLRANESAFLCQSRLLLTIFVGLGLLWLSSIVGSIVAIAGFKRGSASTTLLAICGLVIAAGFGACVYAIGVVMGD